MKKEKELPRTYTKKELAEILQVSEITINNYINKGVVKRLILDGAVRFSQSEVDRLLGVDK